MSEIPADIRLAAEELVIYGPVEGRVALFGLIADALMAERERCAKIAESEPEFPGEPPADIVEAMIEVGPVGNAKAACRATKASIAQRVRSGEQP